MLVNGGCALVRVQVAVVEYQVPGTWYHAIWYQVTGSRKPVPVYQYQVPGTRGTSGTWYQVPGTLCWQNDVCKNKQQGIIIQPWSCMLE